MALTKFNILVWGTYVSLSYIDFKINFWFFEINENNFRKTGMFNRSLSKVLALFSTISIYSLAMASDTFQALDLQDNQLSPAMKEFFQENGYLILKDFFSSETMDQALEEYEKMIQTFPSQKLGEHFFDTGEGAQSSDRYFFDSADHIWPFYNSTAKAHLEAMSADLSVKENLFEYLKIMNKTGHNIHAKNSFFHDLIFNDPRLINFAQELGYDDASTALYQTTIISKSMVEDSRYNAHQDGTFIGAKGKVLAYWIPLTPSTKENGCLWGIPGSHQFPINWWYRKTDRDSFKCTFSGEAPQWDLSKKVYLEVNPRDLLIFPGTFVHGSDPALTKPKGIQDLRIALTYHFGPTDHWDDLTWLKLSQHNTLPFYKK